MTVILDQPPELVWGAFVLGSEVDPDVPWLCQATVRTDFGDPVPIIEFITNSLLNDGPEALVTGWEVRTFPVVFELAAPDGQAMAQAENMLFAQIMEDLKQPLLWTPPMVGAWTGALDVRAVKIARQYDNQGPADWVFDERFNQIRTYELQFTTGTWVRDVDPIEVPALPVPENPDDPPADVPVDECTSTAGWTMEVNPARSNWDYTLAVVGGGLRTTATVMDDLQPPSSFQEIGGYRTATFSTGGLLYLVVDVATGWWVSERDAPLLSPGAITAPAQASAVADLRARVVVDGTSSELAPATVLATADPTVWRYVFELPGASVTFLHVLHHFAEPFVTGLSESDLRHRQRQYWVRTDRVSLTDRIAVDGSSGFQVPRTITIEGAAPTGAAITLDAGDNPLIGSTALIYTGPSEVIPLRALDVGVPPGFTADATMMSGAWNTLDGDTVSRVPVARLAESTYDLLAKLSFTGTALVSWSARLVADDGSDVPGSDVVKSGEVLLRNDTTDPWRIHTIAGIRMPVIKIDGPSTHQVEITVWMETGGAAVKVDERWLADQRGVQTIVHEPSAFQLMKIEIRSPQLGNPIYEVIGTWVDQGSQSIVRLARLGKHLFPPGPLHIFTATDLAKYAACSLRYYRKYPYHPGPALPEIAAA